MKDFKITETREDKKHHGIKTKRKFISITHLLKGLDFKRRKFPEGSQNPILWCAVQIQLNNYSRKAKKKKKKIRAINQKIQTKIKQRYQPNYNKKRKPNSSEVCYLQWTFKLQLSIHQTFITYKLQMIEVETDKKQQ